MTDENKAARKRAEAARDKLNELVVQVSLKRVRLYRALRTDLLDREAPDYEDQKQIRGTLLIQTLHRWARDPVAFLEEAAWSPDRKGNFGSGFVPKNLGLPANMVPIILYPKQRELAKAFKKMIESPTACALVAVKSRQTAFTTIMCWLCLWAWLFTPHGAGVLTTYAEELVDGGGKGQRTPDTLFGRLRMFLDALVTCLPDLRFNSNAGRQKSVDNMIASGLSSSEDVGGKITRPPWIVHDVRLFQSAEGNYLVGDLPSDTFGRSFSVSFVLMDEIGAYDAKQNGLAKKTWNAAASATKVRFAFGTIPETGGTGSFFHSLMHPRAELGDDSHLMTRLFVHWSEIVPYMAGAEWICQACENRNEHPVQPGPGKDGTNRTCERCGFKQLVRYHHLTSPWFEDQCKLMLGDKVGIARELQMDWMAAQGDVLFSSIDGANLVQPHAERRLGLAANFVTLEGLDPGQSMKNSGAWICSRYDPASRRIAIVGYWMSINPHPEYWVPFMKHWSAARTKRMPILYGKYAGKGTFGQIFDYPDDAYRVMDLVSKYPLGEIRGDKFGSHTAGGHSMYMGLADYRIFVGWNYTKDREELVKRGIEWAVRLTIDDEIAKIRPPTPLGGHFPTIDEVFLTAKPKQTEGEAKRTIDVSKKEPPHVHGGADAWFYLVSQLNQVHALALATGGFIEDQDSNLGDGSIDDFNW